jgi:hypothetical protein
MIVHLNCWHSVFLLLKLNKRIKKKIKKSAFYFVCWIVDHEGLSPLYKWNECVPNRTLAEHTYQYTTNVLSFLRITAFDYQFKHFLVQLNHGCIRVCLKQVVYWYVFVMNIAELLLTWLWTTINQYL